MGTIHRISIGVVLALALGATAGPAAAGTFDLNGSGSSVSPPTAGTQAPHQRTQPQPTIVRVTAGNGGFDWGDAGIGAAGGLALSMAGLGGALAVSQGRTRRSGTPRAPIS